MKPLAEIIPNVVGQPPKFDFRRLSAISYANGWTLWHYRSDAACLADMREPGHFNDAADEMASGDHIMLTARDGAGYYAIGNSDTGGIELRKVST